MITYTLYQKNPASHYIYIDLEIEGINADLTELQLPAWRPGRYELGNFAKNIKRVDVFDTEGKTLPYQKQNKDCWQINTKGHQKIKVTYSYYAAEMTAGSCFADVHQIYINPVHCCMYVKGRTDELHRLTVKAPDSYKMACALVSANRTIEARSYDELADSPFIVSPTLQSGSFEVDQVLFYLHFQGECRPDFEKIIKDFTAYTKKQFEFWEEFPVKEYHYLFQITPQRFYHGVEHQASTVIALGPAFAINEGTVYEDLLGVSSHELFHTWNVKFIRPAEMLPYDLSKENYARTGYVYEGFTTYYGDKMLLSSGVFNLQQWFVTFEERLQKHFHNFGRYNLSVAHSSWETWLDGYMPGAPYRKTNIYDEGSLIAFMLDINILRLTGNKRSLRDVCRLLYRRFGKTGKGYGEEDIIGLVNEVAGSDLRPFFNEYVYTPNDFEKPLQDCLSYIGLQFSKKPSQHINEHLFGFKISEGSVAKLTLVAPYSPAWKAGLFSGDEIVAVNGMAVRAGLSQWLTYFSVEDKLTLSYISNEQLKTTILEKDKKNNTWFWIPEMGKKENPTEQSEEAYAGWLAT